MSYKIEKNVEFVPKMAFPFSKMKKGDSFLETDLSKLNTLRVNAFLFSKSKKGEVKFSIRKDGINYRCFRIK